jgi:hypothetical protein
MSPARGPDAARSSYLQRLGRAGYRPRFMADGTPCAVVEQGGCTHPVFVLSIPKAGTYLVGEVLTALGVVPTRLHIDDGWASDFRDFRHGTFMWKYQFEMPVNDGLRLVQPGQFAVGHLPANDAVRASLSGFRKLFVWRDLRHAFVSWSRFVISEQMDGEAMAAASRLPDGPDRVLWVLERPTSAWLVPTCREMVAWQKDPDVLAVQFETLVGDHGERPQADLVNAIVDHLGLQIASDLAVSRARGCIGEKTLTYSGSRSLLSTHWNDALETWFRDVGAAADNEKLGHAASTSR